LRRSAQETATATARAANETVTPRAAVDHSPARLAAHTPADTLVALNDVGALSYFGERRVIDLMGLATPEILPYRRLGEAGVLRYLSRRCPEYLVIFPAWFPELTARTDLFQPVTGVTLPHNVVAGAATMTVYETAWHRDHLPAPLACAGP